MKNHNNYSQWVTVLTSIALIHSYCTGSLLNNRQSTQARIAVGNNVFTKLGEY